MRIIYFIVDDKKFKVGLGTSYDDRIPRTRTVFLNFFNDGIHKDRCFMVKSPDGKVLERIERSFHSLFKDFRYYGGFGRIPGYTEIYSIDIIDKAVDWLKLTVLCFGDISRDNIDIIDKDSDGINSMLNSMLANSHDNRVVLVDGVYKRDRRKPVIIDGVRYDSLKDASESLKLAQPTISNRLKRYYTGYRYECEQDHPSNTEYW